MATRSTQTIKRPKAGGYQTVAFTGTAGTIANAVTCDTVYVRVSADAHISVDVDATATTTDFRAFAGVDYYFPCVKGMKVSAVQVSGGSGGNLYVSEMTS